MSEGEATDVELRSEEESLPAATRRVVLGRRTLVDLGLVGTLLVLTATVTTLVINNNTDMREMKRDLNAGLARIGESVVTHDELTRWSARFPTDLHVPIYIPPEPVR